MNKSLYYIECTFVKDSQFPHVNYKEGEVVYYNPKSASNETYIIRYYGEYFNFFCKSTDLLDGPVEITCSQPNYKFVDYTQAFMRDMMNFNYEWVSYIHKRLNGWSGIDCVKFEFDPIVKQLLNK